jgi:hypothetical protein
MRNCGQSERGRSPVQRATSCASSARASWCEPVSYCHFHSVARAILSLLERVRRPTEPSPPPPCPLATAGGAGGAGRTPQAIGGAQRCRAKLPGCEKVAAVVIAASTANRRLEPAINARTVSSRAVRLLDAEFPGEVTCNSTVSQSVSFFAVFPRSPHRDEHIS